MYLTWSELTTVWTVLANETLTWKIWNIKKEGVYVTIGNPAFCLFLYLTGVHFWRELQHGGDVSQQKIKWRKIITLEIGCVSLSDMLYEKVYCKKQLQILKLQKRVKSLKYSNLWINQFPLIKPKKYQSHWKTTAPPPTGQFQYYWWNSFKCEGLIELLYPQFNKILDCYPKHWNNGMIFFNL